MAKPAVPADWSARLRELVDALPWHAGTDPQSSARDQRAQSALPAPSRTTPVTAPSTAPAIGSRNVTLCREFWSAADVSLPPAIGVCVANDADALGEADALFVLGMLEGLSCCCAEDPVLTDAERDEISLLRLPGEPPLPHPSPRLPALGGCGARRVLLACARRPPAASC